MHLTALWKYFNIAAGLINYTYQHCRSKDWTSCRLDLCTLTILISLQSEPHSPNCTCISAISHAPVHRSAGDLGLSALPRRTSTCNRREAGGESFPLSHCHPHQLKQSELLWTIFQSQISILSRAGLWLDPPIYSQIKKSLPIA